MNDLRVFIIIFNFLLMAVSVGCTPIKRTTKTETVAKVETATTDSTAQITKQRLDIVMRSVAELRETMAEWLNENIDYTESRYDSLGRLISSIKQTTIRNSGRESNSANNVSTFVGLTIEQVDSSLAVKFTSLKSDLKQKEVVVEKKEKTIPTWVGITALLVLIIGLSLFIKKSINL